MPAKSEGPAGGSAARQAGERGDGVDATKEGSLSRPPGEHEQQQPAAADEEEQEAQDERHLTPLPQLR